MSNVSKGYSDDMMERVYYTIHQDFTRWAVDTDAKKFIVCVSGGKDSTVVLNLTAKIFGADNVVGLIIPNREMSDLDLAKNICTDAGVEYKIINIAEAYNSISGQIENKVDGGSLPTNVTNNIPPRLRMTVAYAYAQCFEGGRVINTSNRSEAYVGWTTMWGDNTGDYAPIAGLTCTQVQALGVWLEIKNEYISKVPSDGLCGTTDEEALGFTYKELDTYITSGLCDNFKTHKLIKKRHKLSKFKRKNIRLPQPIFMGIYQDIIDDESYE